MPGDKDLSNLNLKITGKDPINPIEASTIFSNSIIKLKNGEEMSKMIVSKALKNNEELIKNEKKEIEFAKKYQILSKNTALFAEIKNEQKQESELIKVNLEISNKNSNESFNNIGFYKNINNPFVPQGMPEMININPSILPIGFNSYPHYTHNPFEIPPMGMMGMNNMGMRGMNNMGMMAMNNSMNMTGKNNSMNMMGMNNMGMMGMNNMGSMMGMNNMGSMMGMNQVSQNCNMMSNMSPPPMSMMFSPPPPPNPIVSKNMNNMGINRNNDQNNLITTTKIKSNDNLINLITSQDIIEGSWDENEETKKLINIISQQKFDIIKNKILALNKGINENKIIYTILVIYYLNTMCKEKLNDYTLIINKAKKFLNNNGINYDGIINGI